jgi:hypothetical protein
MDTQTSGNARFLLMAALLGGLSGDLLLRTAPWGVNFTLWAIGLLAAITALSWRTRDPLPRESWGVLSLTALSAAGVALRDSDGLTFWNVLATISGAGLLATRTHAGTLARLRLVDLVQNGFLHCIHSIAGLPFLLFKDLRVPSETGRRSRLPWGAIARGTAVALPALLIFGSLLTSADASFEFFVREVLRIDFNTIVGHLFLILFFTWTVGGFLRGRFLAQEIAFPADLRPKGLSLGILEVGIVLGSLDVLFSAFVIVQFPYFFGGQTTILGTPSLTYAEYARRGFFELMTVAFFALPMLLGADWILRKDRPGDVALLRGLSAFMALLLLVILSSATQRLWLYADAYGLTQSRVHAAAVLLWLGLTIVWLSCTVLRGKREFFPFGSVLAAYAVLLALNALNPDALVARVNLNRAETTGKFDAIHAVALSADATPVLLDGIDRLAPEDRDRLARRLLSRIDSCNTRADWRSWNMSRADADRLIRTRRVNLLNCLTEKPLEILMDRDK